jgi:hypothetical protein
MTERGAQELVYEFVLAEPEGILVETWVRGGRQVYRYTTSGVMWSEDLDAGAAVIGPIAECERIVSSALRARVHVV